MTRARRFLLCLLPLLALSTAADPSLDQQRDNYEKAAQALARGERQTYRALLTGLRDYPLYPYLLYADYTINLHRTPAEKIQTFLDEYGDVPVASRLRARWLHHLRRRDRWRDFLDFYREELSSTELACYHQLARYRAGQRQSAVAAALELWQVGESQPEACDPLFAILIDNDHITEAVAWRRYTLAVLNHQYQLAAYVKRFLTSKHYRQLASDFLAIDRNARVIGRYDRFREHTPEVLAVIAHGLQHLARTDPITALAHWNRYHQTHDFEQTLESQVVAALVKGLYRRDNTEAADSLLAGTLPDAPLSLLEWRLSTAIAERDWTAYEAWFSRLPDSARGEHRWRYWYARSLVLADRGETARNTSRALYGELAQERSYYGFLAADWLGQAYRFNHRPPDVEEDQLSALAGQPAFVRVRELRHHDDILSARREWYHALASGTEREWIVAAHLAERWQWPNMAIMSMIRAGYWDDIGIRFPRPFADLYRREAEDKDIPLPLLFALSRQESAFSPTIVSPAGARGLMQLMPATARQVARELGVPFRGSHELRDPALNIRLGATYYRQMLNRFDNNRILATAAYNAGPHRVERWLRDSKGSQPFDVWIETIPFRETRHYVQNVLAFSIIYSHHLGLKIAMLSQQEKDRKL